MTVRSVVVRAGICLVGSGLVVACSGLSGRQGMLAPGVRFVVFAFGHHRPDLPGVFVGNGDQGFVVADALREGDHPALFAGA